MMSGSEKIMFGGRVSRVHFIGIAGVGMSAIAAILRARGFEVSGSDLVQSETSRRLEGAGIRVQSGHHAQNVMGADVVVMSSAIWPDNIEIQQAKKLGIPVISRAEMLGEVMRYQEGIAIAGSHGKTTTAGMVAMILSHAGADPTVIVGGMINDLGSNAKLGRGGLLVAEADESDGSFLMLSPRIVAVTNIGSDHLDYYGTKEKLQQGFSSFINKVPFYGLAVLCIDSDPLRELLPTITGRVATYGLNEGTAADPTSYADYVATSVRADGLQTSFVPIRRGEAAEPIFLPMIGPHNVRNALAALAIADELDVPYEQTRAALRRYGGVSRRFSCRGNVGGILVVDDYAHHPDEIITTLKAARTALGRRVLAVFQPHRYSRVQEHFEAFTRAFDDADIVFVAPIYEAGESPLPGIDAPHLAQAIRDQGHPEVVVAASLSSLRTHLLDCARSGDLILTLGAGSITELCEGLVDDLRKKTTG